MADDMDPEVSKVLSFSDFIKRMNLVLHNEEDFNEIPTVPEKYGLQDEGELKNLISQYLLIYSGNLDTWADDSLEPSQARMIVQLATSGNSFTRRIIPDIQTFAAAHLPEGYTIEISGIALIENALVNLIVDTQTYSILLSLFMVFVILSISYRSPAAGFFGSIPLAFSIMINFAVMGYTGIRLDISTAMVASVAMGIGIDYTIHFMSGYAGNRARNMNPKGAAARTISTTGKAILFNALSVGAGFAVLILSQFKPLKYFGFLIALTMLTSSIGAMTLVPVILEVFKPRFIENTPLKRRKS